MPVSLKIKQDGEEKQIQAEPGTPLDLALLAAGIIPELPCAGRGKCGKCKVKVKGGFSELSERERELLGEREVKEGIRLACQARVTGPAEVFLEKAQVVTEKVLLAAEQTPPPEASLGLAVDLGTTTVAAFLCDQESGRIYKANAVLNQQSAYGAEVMSRLAAALEQGPRLKELAWRSMAEAAKGLSLRKEERMRVRRAVAVGNSAMFHLALGLPVDTLVRSPFKPFRYEAAAADPGPLSSLFPGLKEIWFAPLIQGFVGADALSCLLFFGFYRGLESGSREKVMVMDLGTNGEVLLSAGGKIFAASAAAGPAFEGVNISCGMRANPRAAVKAELDEKGRIRLKTIGGGEAEGLSGAGLLSALRLLLDAGSLDPSGRLRKNGKIPVEEKDGKPAVRLSDKVWLSQEDVRELQKAKAAVRSAADILLEEAGLSPRELSRLILTGGFGTAADPEDALALGVIPPAPRSRVFSLGNGAGMGAAMMLNPDNFNLARSLREKVMHVELNLNPRFMERFVASMSLAPEPALPSSD